MTTDHARHPTRSLYRHLKISRRLTSGLALLYWLATSSAVMADPRPLLWRVEGPHPSFLFGTIHTANPEFNQLPAAVDAAFTAADQFYGELALDPATQHETLRLFSQPAGHTLQEQLEPARQQRVNRVLQRINPALTLDALNSLQLWALTLSLTVLEDQLTYAGAPMMDQRLYDAAQAQHKTSGGLETPAEQAAVFNQLSHREQLYLLDATLDYLEQAQASNQAANAEAYRIYREGDPNDFIDLFGEQLDVPLGLKLKLQRLLLSDRNERMATRIDALLSANPDQRFFFAVGAAHLADANGIPALLRQLGYRVVRADP